MVTRGWVLALLALGGTAWLMLLSGLAAAQANCNNDDLQQGATLGYLGAAPCGNIFGYTWWITWYQFFLLCGITAAITKRMDRWRPVLLGFLGPVTTLLMDTANTFVYFDNLPITGKGRLRLLVGGAVLSAIVNLVLVVVIAMFEDEEIIGPSPMAPPKPSVPSAVI